MYAMYLILTSFNVRMISLRIRKAFEFSSSSKLICRMHIKENPLNGTKLNKELLSIYARVWPRLLAKEYFFYFEKKKKKKEDPTMQISNISATKFHCYFNNQKGKQRNRKNIITWLRTATQSKLNKKLFQYARISQAIRNVTTMQIRNISAIYIS